MMNELDVFRLLLARRDNYWHQRDSPHLRACLLSRYA